MRESKQEKTKREKMWVVHKSLTIMIQGYENHTIGIACNKTRFISDLKYPNDNYRWKAYRDSAERLKTIANDYHKTPVILYLKGIAYKFKIIKIK